ncbi:MULTISPECIES: hypothetical protein [Chryseobacterium]|uniref:30S ribosomal protein S16 n=1 Tax=Chryseobacterium herbae TaxID=2976476 RepID=A0ABT2J0M6_9FLAO|nr:MULTISPECIES: hypothetical protein [unclassified Chryseobacterium]KFF20614.1 30S ribosomal protein S16 [Chryseobacterium sp. JM1]MCT2564395.1 hypothetical protein [Chryseobacterium sp. pc1-10]
MESIIVHPKNPMEMSALKSVLKDMNIRYERTQTKNTFHTEKVAKKIFDKKNPEKPSKPKGQ